jgi:hypothetical protein
MARRELLLAVLACGGLPLYASAQFVPGDLYISAYDRIYHVDVTDWTFSTFADASDGLTEPGGVTFSPSGSLLCANFDTDQILAFDASGVATVLLDAANGLDGPAAVTYDAACNLFESNDWTSQVLLFPSGGGAASVVADSSSGVLYPGDIIVEASGRTLFTDFYPLAIWSVDAAGTVAVFDTLPASPMSLALRTNGDVYVTVGYSGSGISVYRYPSGDASQRYLLCNFPKSFGWAALQVSLDQKTLYFATDDELYTIDADAGVAANVIDKSKQFYNSYAIAVFRPRANWSNYGTGFLGSNGVPAFTSQANPVLGTTVTVDLANSYGQPTIGLLFAGFQQANLHTAWGGDLLVVPSITFPITFSYGFNSFAGALPDDPLLAGTKLDLQAIEADPGAAKGVSFTQGLELVLGY